MAGIPGAIAAVILSLTGCYKAWLAARRVRIRLGNSEIEASSAAEVLSILRECAPIAEVPSADGSKIGGIDALRANGLENART